MSDTRPSDSSEPLEPKLSDFGGPLEGLLKLGAVRPPSSAGTLGRVERYDLLKFVGAGGMGIVFLARDTQSGKQVALKLLRPELATRPQAIELFLREVRLMRQLSHPHILPILDWSESPERIWFAMAYLEAGSVAHRLRGGQALPTEVAIRIVRQVAEALQFAHDAKGILHRDLKPENILLDQGGDAYLTDFGLARDLSGDSIAWGTERQWVGTAAYMSPLAAEGGAEDKRGDIYSLGAVLYELLTGQPPYQGGSAQEVLQQVKQGPPRPLREVRPECPPEAAAVVEAAMARPLRERYASVEDLITDLDRIAMGRAPLGSHGQWRTPRRWRAVLRHRRARLLAAVGALGLAGLLWGLSRPSLVLIDTFDLPAAPLQCLMLGDVGEHGPEFVYMHSNHCFIVSRHQRFPKDFVPTNLPPAATNLSLIMVGDVNNDARSEIVLSWWEDGKEVGPDEKEETVRAAAFSPDGRMVGSYSIAGRAKRQSDLGWHRTGLTAIYGNISGTLKPTILTNLKVPENDLLLSVRTGWGLNPRGLVCFAAAQTNAIRWGPFSIAPPPHEAAIIRYPDGDDQPDAIALGTSAPSNGHRLADGTDDSHSYLYLIEPDGKGFWTNELGGAFSRVTPLAVAGPRDKPRVYAAVARDHEWQVAGHSNLVEVGKLCAFDIGPQVTPAGQKDLGATIVDCTAEDLNDDLKGELLATDRLGRLHVVSWALDRSTVYPIVDQACLKNARDSIDLHLVGILPRHNRPPNEKLIVLHSAYNEVLKVGVGNQKDTQGSTKKRDCRLHVLDASRGRVAERRLPSSWDGTTVQVWTADWDGDGLAEILAISGSRVLVYKLR